jgi:hypothetical protein
MWTFNVPPRLPEYPSGEARPLTLSMPYFTGGKASLAKIRCEKLAPIVTLAEDSTR